MPDYKTIESLVEHEKVGFLLGKDKDDDKKKGKY